MISNIFQIQTSTEHNPYWCIGDGDGFFLTWNGPIFVTTLASTDAKRVVATREDVEVCVEREFVDHATGIILMRPRGLTRHDSRHIIAAKFKDLQATSNALTTNQLLALLNEEEVRSKVEAGMKDKERAKAALLMPVTLEERMIDHPELGRIEITEHAASRITEHMLDRGQLQPPNIPKESEGYTFWSIRKGLQFLVKQLQKALEKRRKNSVKQTLKYKDQGRYFINIVDRVVLVITAAEDGLHQLRTAYFKSKEELKSLYA